MNPTVLVLNRITTRGVKATALATLVTGFLTTSAWGYGPFSWPATKYIKPGDSVTLNQSISAAYGAKIFVQDGAAIQRSEVRWAQPFCYFHLYRDPSVVETEANLAAGSFKIESTINHYDHVSVDQRSAVFAGMGGFFTQEASEQTIVTRFKLNSSVQPEVIGLNCGIWAVPNERNHLSLDEIRGALGDVVSLDIASGSE